MMAIQLPEKCLRNKKSCSPLAQIKSDNKIGKKSFICCGLNNGSTRAIEQDIFTVCWVNNEFNEISDWDETDLIDTASVFIQALSAYGHIKRNGA